MQVDGAGTQFTAAGQAESCFSHAAGHRTQKEDRRAHLSHQPVGHMGARDRFRVNGYTVTVPLHPASQLFEDAAGGSHIGEPGAVFDGHFFFAEHRCR